MSNKQVITRFAPSPTGYLHIGGARTALYNYLLAKKHGGKFILRIEDTDRERSTDEAIQAILDGMKWLGLTWDEGPFFQSQRLDHYQAAIEKLLKNNKAYPCFCSPEELNKKRKAAQAAGVKYKYDRTCYQLPNDERQKKIKAGTPHTIRFYSPDKETITLHDHIKGRVRVNTDELDDLIIRRSDGSPTYNLTVVVDDVEMGITYVIRGDDHLNNTFRQIQLYQALGHPVPEFAHLPLILGTDKKPLSKRHGATNVMNYRERGYLPQALLNYLVRLGWSYKDQEIFSMDEMIRAFSLQGCSSAAGIFNPEKLDWLNGHYIRKSDPAELAPVVKEILEKDGVKKIDESVLVKAVAASQKKVKTLKEMANFIKLFFTEVAPDKEAIEENLTEETKPILKRVAQDLEAADNVEHDTVHQIFERIMAEFDVKLGTVANPVRVAISGLKISPGVYDLIQLFGKEESLRRIRQYVDE